MLVLSLLVSFVFAQDPYLGIEKACMVNLKNEKNVKKICACIKRNYKKEVSFNGAKMMLLTYQKKDLGDLPEKIEGSQAIFDFDKDIKQECIVNPSFVNEPEGPPKKIKKK